MAPGNTAAKKSEVQGTDSLAGDVLTSSCEKRLAGSGWVAFEDCLPAEKEKYEQAATIATALIYFNVRQNAMCRSHQTIVPEQGSPTSTRWGQPQLHPPFWKMEEWFKNRKYFLTSQILAITKNDKYHALQHIQIPFVYAGK
jgi:hypothetical protein